MAKRSATARVLAGMLKENTGASFLDSGSAYGRNWQRNQAHTFADEPESTVEFDLDRDGDLEVGFTYNVFHWLNHRLTYAPEMQRRLNRFEKRNEGLSVYELREQFPDYLRSLGLDVEERGTVNTYNGGDSALSQIILYSLVEIEGEGTLVLLQVHGGCDARGGYTPPKCFWAVDADYLFDDSRCTLFDSRFESFGAKGMYFDSDNGGYSFEPGEYHVELPLFGKSIYVKAPDFKDMPKSEDPELIGDGVHLVVWNKRAFLPHGAELVAGGSSF